MLIPALLLAGVGGGAYAVRRLVTRRAEEESGARLDAGADGIVRGAEPIALRGSGPHGVLLLHGLGDTPQTLGYLAADLHRRGFSVRAPLLPGHGRSLREFAASRAAQWTDAARSAYVALCEEHSRVGLVGLSMGGALASIVAAERDDVPALVLLAPYLGVPPIVRWLGRAHPIWDPVVPYVRGRGEESVQDESERPRSRAYGYFTARLLRELALVVEQATVALPRIAAPTLLIQSRHDNRILPEVAEGAFARLGSAEKRLVWTEGGAHIITVDFGRERVFELTADWLESHMLIPARAPPRRTTHDAVDT
ncbi:MAG TPA: alpha/beta fold hydrolase [Gemmatimonadaceae bacterium]|nr:alpha/beta fold hydrolase [Gemmatimonadaceae bacterium]